MFIVVIITSDVDFISELLRSCLHGDLAQYRQMGVDYETAWSFKLHVSPTKFVINVLDPMIGETYLLCVLG